MEVRRAPVPRPLRTLRFARQHGMLNPQYGGSCGATCGGASDLGRLAVGDRQAGVLRRDLQLQVGKRGSLRFGRFTWIGDGTKIRCHEGVVEIGAKTVMGQECTISAYQHVRIGEECVIADRAMFIDFDHGIVEVERPIRHQGIYKRDVAVGVNVWIGYGMRFLRGDRRRQLGRGHERRRSA